MRRGAAVLTPPVLAQTQALLEPPAVADQLGIKRDTLSNAVRDGRLHKQAKKGVRNGAEHQART